MVRAISVIIKPVLGCSMGCVHCYHSPEELSSTDRLSFERLEKLFSIVSREYDAAWFIWHGGEPLELPFSFWKKAIELQRKYFGDKTTGNTIQTNGVNLDRRMIDFCKKNEINIGISHEGPCDGILRRDCDRVENLIVKMSDKERVFSVSQTLPAGAETRQKEIYDHFRDIGTALTISPVIPIGHAAEHPELVPDTDAYIKANIETFDAWLNDPEAPMPLSPHYLYVLQALGDPQPSDCPHDSCLTKWLCIYPDGSLYPCGKACPKSMMLGNIDDIGSVYDAFRTPGFAHIAEGSIARRDKCASCEIFEYCQGGCSIDAYWEGDIRSNGNPQCRIYKAVFTHIKKEMDSIISEEKDLSNYNRFVREAVLSRITNPVF